MGQAHEFLAGNVHGNLSDGKSNSMVCNSVSKNCGKRPNEACTEGIRGMISLDKMGRVTENPDILPWRRSVEMLQSELDQSKEAVRSLARELTRRKVEDEGTVGTRPRGHPDTETLRHLVAELRAAERTESARNKQLTDRCQKAEEALEHMRTSWKHDREAIAMLTRVLVASINVLENEFPQRGPLESIDNRPLPKATEGKIWEKAVQEAFLGVSTDLSLLPASVEKASTACQSIHASLQNRLKYDESGIGSHLPSKGSQLSDSTGRPSPVQAVLAEEQEEEPASTPRSTAATKEESPAMASNRTDSRLKPSSSDGGNGMAPSDRGNGMARSDEVNGMARSDGVNGMARSDGVNGMARSEKASHVHVVNSRSPQQRAPRRSRNPSSAHSCDGSSGGSSTSREIWITPTVAAQIAAIRDKYEI
eukprot:TRINITY_DN1179_c0_g1_i1.p1 TRINITY_DN1179_c0_g1~~TRINITY_DN1179_c0_g1_i1.p1  ORF type:complete len:422 (+),score=49.76 TRINITY_DN1179_c0_g1_i1:131-1396(+)